ncbi:alpha/beta hydrolase [Actinokineospora globicatena]|uniref:alpha/beta hydrolase n=1 Tax=Actinokineospora globicatena TaxID=103729 RepID=UPI0020A3C612|nr:esterase [Actinokineospora globicatena]MCP2304241.1 S-formylglutathione hydrolase FrmB [Actinokineospora globicatena]GLW78398.1 esterase [Actinokineospora globicatena]GLW84938.1 esterase [Actinokineospora globicatena]
MDGRWTRRGFLLAAAAAAAGCGAREQPPAAAPPAPLPSSQPPVDSTSVSNLIWRSSIGDVKMIVMRPREVAGPLPVCLALHGEGTDANQFVEIGLPPLLTATVRAGTRPFAVVAVDGGTASWLGAPQKMLAEELPDWLSRAELAATPFSVLGISSGAVGAFEYARTPGLALLTALSPAVFTSWRDAERFGGYTDEAQWERSEPLRHLTAVAGLPFAVWCGTDDPLLPAARELAQRTKANPATFGAGDHTTLYWKKILPEVLRFVGDSLGKKTP